MNVLSLQPGISRELEGQDDIVIIVKNNPGILTVYLTNAVNQTANLGFGPVFFFLLIGHLNMV
jgi:hypothetical protein